MTYIARKQVFCDHGVKQLDSDQVGNQEVFWFCIPQNAPQFRGYKTGAALTQLNRPSPISRRETMRLALGRVFAALAMISISGPAVAIQIIEPSPAQPWTQDAQNIIKWTFVDTDPKSFSIEVTNSNKTLLNGEFTIAAQVDTSDGVFTVANVTLAVGSGYEIIFADELDSEATFAESAPFSILPP